jgi:outer membrane lipoprotein-sorting protein
VRVFLMRRFTLVLLLLAMMPVWGAGLAAAQPVYPYSDQQKADLDKISAYLNAIRSLKASFVQIGPEGTVDQGDLFIQKPGQIRFAYHPPSALLIVATGGSVYVKNSRLNTVDRYSLSETPLGLLLNDNVDLKTNRSVMGVTEQNGDIILQARTNVRHSNPDITLVFSTPGIELRQWTVRDNQGGNTTVALESLEPGAGLDSSLFAVPVKEPLKMKQGSN